MISATRPKWLTQKALQFAGIYWTAQNSVSSPQIHDVFFAQTTSAKRQSAPHLGSTYRLQFNRHFTLNDAYQLIPYLKRLGIKTVYASPLLAAVPGSSHGYNTVDPARIDPERGTLADFYRFSDRLHDNGMLLMLDIVPNHMGVGKHNAWWMDVLANGKNSKYADFFDIQWTPSQRSLHHKVLLPVLGKPLSNIIEAGELKLVHNKDTGKFSIAYYDHEFPIARELQPWLRPHHLAALTLQKSDDAVTRQEKIRRWETLLSKQHYQLAYWKQGPTKINYRRFFDVNDLAALRIEDPKVFEATHEFILDLIRRDKIDALRIDHVDGLADPKQYLERLQQAIDAAGKPAFPVLVEKILAPHETLTKDWPVAGTSGYDWLNELNGLFVDPSKAEQLAAVYQQFTEDRVYPIHQQDKQYEMALQESKRLIIQQCFKGDLNQLATRIVKLAKFQGFDFSRQQINHALTQLLVYFPVYRIYATQPGLSDEITQREHFDTAWYWMKQHDFNTISSDLMNWLGKLLTLQPEVANHPHSQGIARRFQQLSATVMAKGMEDTFLYRFNRLGSHNEVGGEPSYFATPVYAFHLKNQSRQSNYPSAMLTTSTHDTKRSADIRARLNVLSEIPEVWGKVLAQWSVLNVSAKTQSSTGQLLPSKNDEYLFYQTLIGIWPGENLPQRLADYMIKAVREAKINSSWIQPDTVYENALRHFVKTTLDNPTFMRAFHTFQANILPAGQINTLAQTALKLTAPGTPDTYQGEENWHFALVDPDNRRPVDFKQLATQLEDVKPDQHTAKLYATSTLLGLRAQYPVLFEKGHYIPLEVTGPNAHHLIAFARVLPGQSPYTITVVPRLTTGLLNPQGQWKSGVWKDTMIQLPTDSTQVSFDHLWTQQSLKAKNRLLSVEAILKNAPFGVLISGE